MHQPIEVVYENGVLRPLGVLPNALHEGEHYLITLDAPLLRKARLDAACLAAARQDADATVSLDEVRQILARIPGTLAATVRGERADH
jgi:predicted DNA-binding antitoxin AbrB/MazE fold protein